MANTAPFSLSELPYALSNFESIGIYKQLTKSSRALAELKGVVKSIPNEEILLNTLALQEAKDSSEVENIVTTHDELFRNQLDQNFDSIATKEVQNYTEALKRGWALVQGKGLLLNKHILEIQETLEKNKAGFRAVPGTSLKNQKGEVIYTPPQHPEDIINLMSNLEAYINNTEMQDLDPLIKMAIIHFQFESIHPFYDGNGRTGRIINVLFLTVTGLLDLPVLYLSRFINQNKADYYHKIQNVRDENAWEDWVLFMLKTVEETANETIRLIRIIQKQMHTYKKVMREQTKFYSKDLLEHLFRHPYTKVQFLQKELGKHRQTVSTYLDKLCELNLLKKETHGNTNYYINRSLFELLKNGMQEV
ncbi:Fic family protein [Persicobacter diffluens]